MRVNATLVTSVLAAGWLTIACSGTNDRVTTPSAVGAPEAVGSSPPAGYRSPPPPVPPPPPASGNCDASKAAWAIGGRASSDLLERARLAAGASVARFIRPNQPITTEYSGARLNLGLSAQEVVQSVSCG